MEIWRVICKRADQEDKHWIPINNKIYTQRRFATSALKSGRYSMTYDPDEHMWVSNDGRMVYRVIKAEVRDEEWVNVPPKN